jgi:hypothetical protein
LLLKDVEMNETNNRLYQFNRREIPISGCNREMTNHVNNENIKTTPDANNNHFPICDRGKNGKRSYYDGIPFNVKDDSLNSNSDYKRLKIPLTNETQLFDQYHQNHNNIHFQSNTSTFNGHHQQRDCCPLYPNQKTNFIKHQNDTSTSSDQIVTSSSLISPPSSSKSGSSCTSPQSPVQIPKNLNGFKQNYQIKHKKWNISQNFRCQEGISNNNDNFNKSSLNIQNHFIREMETIPNMTNSSSEIRKSIEPFHFNNRHLSSSIVDKIFLDNVTEALVSRDTIKRCIRKAKHRGNFAANLAAEIFSKEERITCNCTGTRGKRQLSPRRIQMVKEITFKVYNSHAAAASIHESKRNPNSESAINAVANAYHQFEEIWRKECITAIDAKNRSIGRDLVQNNNNGVMVTQRNLLLHSESNLNN